MPEDVQNMVLSDIPIHEILNYIPADPDASTF